MRNTPWFELPALDLDRACRFYEAIGYETSRDSECPEDRAILKIGSTLLGQIGVDRSNPPSGTGTRVFLPSPNVFDQIESLVETSSGKVLSTNAVPEGCVLISDSEGNVLVLQSAEL